MIPSTTDRVLLFTDSQKNHPITEQARDNVARFASASPQMLDQRLRELHHEWNIERLTGVWVAIPMLAGLGLATFLGTGWLLVPFTFSLFLLLHGLFGWSPAWPLGRRMGYRTAWEIAHERFALKALRGDFQRLDVVTTTQDREDLARFEDEGGPPAPEPASAASDSEVVNEAIRAVRT